MTATAMQIPAHCQELAQSAKAASRVLASLPGAKRDKALRTIADRLRSSQYEVLAANARDVDHASDFGLTPAQVDRLRLDSKRLSAMADAVEQIAAFPDPIGRVIESSVRPNGLEVQKVRVPLGVVLFIYESRPNVTTDAAALCLKSGNAVILRGGKEARNSNLALGSLIHEALVETGVPPAAIQVVEVTDRQAVGELLRLDGWIDVAIPRGGEELIRRVAAEATMPVLKHYKGVCHVYVDASADADMAVAIVENAKCQRPGVCNAAETLLVHSAAAERVLPAIAARLRSRQVELRACPRAKKLVPEAVAARDDDFGTEFMDLILAVKIVDGLEEAIEHIARFGSAHTDTIVTNDWSAARRFTQTVDSAAVMVNASTRFNDGGEFGLGAEIGISTDKFHARGPCGLNELTSYKYIVYGSGQIRE